MNDKDREEAEGVYAAFLGGGLEYAAVEISRIRAEAYKEGYEKGSSEHGAIYISRKLEEEAERACREAASKALQKAAERVSEAWLTTECWKDDLTLSVIRAAIIGGEKG